MKKRSLYSVDTVTAGERFSSIVRVLAKSKVGRPGFPEPDLSAWRTGYEIDDRVAVIERSAACLESLKVFRRLDDGDAYKCLVDVAPEFLDEFLRRGELNVERYFRETVSRAGEIRSDRPTIPVAGSLFTEGNVRRLFAALRYALERWKNRPQAFFWLVPQVAGWGTTRVLPIVLDQIDRLIGTNAGDEEESPQTRSTAFAGDWPCFVRRRLSSDLIPHRLYLAAHRTRRSAPGHPHFKRIRWVHLFRRARVKMAGIDKTGLSRTTSSWSSLREFRYQLSRIAPP
jgi:hypothetical protein